MKTTTIRKLRSEAQELCEAIDKFVWKNLDLRYTPMQFLPSLLGVPKPIALKVQRYIEVKKLISDWEDVQVWKQKVASVAHIKP